MRNNLRKRSLQGQIDSNSHARELYSLSSEKESLFPKSEVTRRDSAPKMAVAQVVFRSGDRSRRPKMPDGISTRALRNGAAAGRVTGMPPIAFHQVVPGTWPGPPSFYRSDAVQFGSAGILNELACDTGWARPAWERCR